MTDVSYSLIRSYEQDPAAYRYWLLRKEGEETETLATGQGLSMRLHIIAYLRDVAQLDGPDGPAAIAAMKRGWLTGTARPPQI